MRPTHLSHLPRLTLSRPCTTMLALAAGLAMSLSTGVAAQAYPNGPVRVVVPYAAGGPTDVYARMIATGLAEQLRSTFLVENKAGVATIPGAQAAAQGSRDGQTLFFTTSTTFSSNPLLYKSLPYKVEDFAPVSLVGTSPITIAISATLPVKNVAEFVAHVKARPGKLAMGTIGAGSTTFLAAKTFERMNGLNMIEVPYKGSPEALRALLAEDIVLYPDGISGVLPLHKSGKVRIIAVTSAARAAELPDVPSMVELGFPDFIVTNWFALFSITGTPREAISRLNAAAVRIVAADEFRTRLANNGVKAESSTPDGLAELVKFHAGVTRKLFAPLNIEMQ